MFNNDNRILDGSKKKSELGKTFGSHIIPSYSLEWIYKKEKHGALHSNLLQTPKVGYSTQLINQKGMLFEHSFHKYIMVHG